MNRKLFFISSPIRCQKRAILLAFFILPALFLFDREGVAQPSQSSNLNAFHRSGQTFLTWFELTDLHGEQYRVYRHTAPITVANLNQARLLVTLPEGSSAYHTERMRATDYPPEANGGYTSLRTYVIEPLGPELRATTGLFVWTTTEPQNSYYAVTTVYNGEENRSAFSGENTIGPIQEIPADPEPILVWESENGLGRVYTQFMDFANWNPTFETTDGLTYAYNYFVGLPSPEQCSEVTPDQYALILHIEGYGSRYEAGDGSHYYCAIELWCDDPRQSWYYGYSATHQYTPPESAPVTTGPIVNFTEERLLRAVYDTLRDPRYNIDPERVYSYGHSMGGSGALALALRYPNVFAAVYCSEPMTNYREGSTGTEGLDWVGSDLEPKWGSVALNLPIENRGVYAGHLTRYNGTGVWDWQNHQANLIERRGDDMAFISLAHGTLDRVIAWESQGRLGYEPFCLSRRAFSGAIVEADHTWIGFNGQGPTAGELWEPGASGPFYGLSFVRNETLPGLTYASGSLPPVPDRTGGYNMTLEWSASWNDWAGPPIDTPGWWEIAIRSLDGDQTVDVTPRRLQQFLIHTDVVYTWENRRVSDNALVANGTVTADEDGLITVTGFAVSPSGNRLIINRGSDILTPPPIVTDTPVPTRLQTNTPTMTSRPQPSTPTPYIPSDGISPIPLEIRFPEGITGAIPVTLGVPLPRGEWNPSEFMVTSSNGSIPSQIRNSVRSGIDDTISWLLVDFQAEARYQYWLEQGESPIPSQAITVTESGDGSFVIDTGAGRYHIAPNNNIFEAIEGPDGGARILGATWDLPERPAQIEFIERGPLRTMVCLRSQEAVQGLDLTARIHFFAGLPYVRVRLTLTNHTPASMGWEVPGADNGDCEVSSSQPIFQGLNSPGMIAFDDITWSLLLANPEGSEEILYQDSSGTENWDFYVGQGPRMQSGVIRRGFVHLRDGVEVETGNIAEGILTAGGIQMYVPWFRELFPKALRAREGRLELGLFPGEYSIDHRFRTGEQKTHDIWITLDSSSTPPGNVIAHPAFSWLRSTHGLGYIGPRREDEFFDYEDYLDAQFDPTRENRDGLAASVNDAQVQWDLFGWTDFGDLPTDFEDGRSPYNVKYDVSLGFLHQALRINGAEWWRWAEISNRHFADIDIYHARVRGYESTRNWYDGGAWGHSMHDESGLTNPHRNCNSPHPDLYYGVTGLVAWSLLTGDEGDT